MIKQSKLTTETVLVTTLEIVDHIVGNGGNSLQCGTFHHETRFGPFRLPLGADDLATSLGLGLQLVVLDLPQREVLSAPGWLHVLHSHMDSLPDDSVAHLKDANNRGSSYIQ